MNSKIQEQHLTDFHIKQKQIICSKRSDYASEDVMSNFKLVAQIVGIPIEQVLMVFIATKTVRKGNLLAKGVTPENESLEDSILDGANYEFLLSCALKEKAKALVEVPKNDHAPHFHQITKRGYVCDKCEKWIEGEVQG